MLRFIKHDKTKYSIYSYQLLNITSLYYHRKSSDQSVVEIILYRQSSVFFEEIFYLMHFLMILKSSRIISLSLLFSNFTLIVFLLSRGSGVVLNWNLCLV